MKNNLDEVLEINPMNNKKYIEAVSFRDWQTCDLICDEHSVLVGRIKHLEQELQKTREQLEKTEKVISELIEAIPHYEDCSLFDDEDADCDCHKESDIKAARQYFKDKDKQGEG